MIFAWICLALFTFPLLFFVNAPYGKFYKEQDSALFLPKVNGRIGWFVQEITSPLVFVLYFIWPSSKVEMDLKLCLLCLWVLHYFNRTVIYCLRAPSIGDTRLSVVLMAMGFNVVNGYLNASYISQSKELYGQLSVQQIIGFLLFIVGAYVNISSDEILFQLRRNQKTRSYFIPYGRMYKYISCPNYFGEILEWIGFALVANTPAAWAFVLWTCANLIPRAVQTHKWYKMHFKSKYPSKRKAIIPYLI